VEGEAAEGSLQRLAHRGDDRGVEGVAHRQQYGVGALVGEGPNRALDRLGRSADDRLAGAVDVGDDDVAVDRADDSFDLLQRGEHGRHGAVVLQRE
jgi:hypothetical protein